MRFTPLLPAMLCALVALPDATLAQTPSTTAPPTAQAPTPAATSSRKAARAATARRAKAVAAPAAAVDPATSDVAAAREQLQRERSELEALRGTTLNLIRLMVQEGVLPKDKAKLLLGDAEGASLPDPAPRTATPATATPATGTAAGPDATPPGGEATAAESGTRRKRGQTIRVPYLPETVKNEIRDQLRQEVLAQAKSERWAEPGTLPEWLDRIVWEGDLRLRYQGEYFQPGNVDIQTYRQLAEPDLAAGQAGALPDTQSDRGLYRMRMRLGMLAKISETFGAGFRIASGTGSPVSTNMTLGGGVRSTSLVLDRAYLKWDPRPWLSLSGGRMPNPWFWPTDIVWDEDLNFDGFAASVKPRFTDRTTAFLTAGAFPLQVADGTPLTPRPRDKWLVGVQAGGEWQAENATRLKLGFAVFDFRDVQGMPNPAGTNSQENDWSVPSSRQKGNSLFDINQGTLNSAIRLALAPKYRVLNLGGEFDFARFDPVIVKVAGDYIRNIGFDRDEIRARTGIDLDPKITGYQARLTVGRDAIRVANDWQVFVGYRYLERDATLDAFTDSDFYLGGTNTRGYFIGGFYGLDRNAYLRVRYLSGNEITPLRDPVTSAALPLSIDVFQFDVNVRF